jgi:RNA polymerase sigma factor for flagellar operon FliA
MTERETEMWRRWHTERDERARTWLIEHYTPLVANVLRSFCNVRRSDREDLTGAGYVGLIEAVDTWDPTLKDWAPFVRFRVRAKMVDQIRDLSWVPKSVRTLARQLGEAAAALEAENRGSPPTDAELADRMGVSVDELAQLRSKTEAIDWGVASLDYREEGEGSYLEAIPDPGADTAAVAEQRDRTKLLRSILDRLPPRLAFVLEGRFVHNLPQKRMAEQLGVHESRVSQLLVEALAQAKQLAYEQLLEVR